MTNGPPLHLPALQASFLEHPFESLQAVPSAAIGFEQVPVSGSQLPATWQLSEAAQTTPAHLSTPGAEDPAHESRTAAIPPSAIEIGVRGTKAGFLRGGR